MTGINIKQFISGIRNQLISTSNSVNNCDTYELANRWFWRLVEQMDTIQEEYDGE